MNVIYANFAEVRQRMPSLGEAIDNRAERVGASCLQRRAARVVARLAVARGKTAGCAYQSATRVLGPVSRRIDAGDAA